MENENTLTAEEATEILEKYVTNESNNYHTENLSLLADHLGNKWHRAYCKCMVSGKQELIDLWGNEATRKEMEMEINSLYYDLVEMTKLHEN